MLLSVRDGGEHEPYWKFGLDSRICRVALFWARARWRRSPVLSKISLDSRNSVCRCDIVFILCRSYGRRNESELATLEIETPPLAAADC
jgi:hypothetical protein